MKLYLSTSKFDEAALTTTPAAFTERGDYDSLQTPVVVWTTKNEIRKIVRGSGIRIPKAGKSIPVEVTITAS